MADGVTIYFLRPAFGLKDGTAATSKRIYADPAGAPADIKYKDAATGFDAAHVVACIDVDELNKPGPDGKDQSVAPFGFGIRADGKIIYGARADEWMDKDIQQQ